MYVRTLVMLLPNMETAMTANSLSSDRQFRDPDDWKTGDEPMTESQDSYVHTLAQEAGQSISEDMTKAEASKKIDELQKKTGRGKKRRRHRSTTKQ